MCHMEPRRSGEARLVSPRLCPEVRKTERVEEVRLISGSR